MLTTRPPKPSSVELVVVVACVESITFGHVATHVQKDVLFQTCASAGQAHQAG